MVVVRPCSMDSTMPATESSTEAVAEPWIEVTGSRDFADWLAEQRVSLAFTTYQAGKLFFLGRHPDSQLEIGRAHV